MNKLFKFSACYRFLVFVTLQQLSKLMVVGIDTYHDSAKKGRSAVGFISSMNKNLTRYYSRVTFQERNMELADKVTVCYTGRGQFAVISVSERF